MNAFMNFLKGSLITIWVIIAIFTTICLISYNDYNVSEFGSHSLFIVDNESLEPTFNKNDIVIVNRELESKYDVDSEVFFYSPNRDINSYINLGKITKVERVDNAEDGFYFNDTKVSYSDILGSGNKAVVIRHLGLLLKLLESRWGFMMFVILPTIYAVIYEGYLIFRTVKTEYKKEMDKENL